MYSCIQGEPQSLELKGYKCMIIGDLNAHVGVPPEGIEGNRPGVNSNGHKLLNFVSNNYLVMLNRDKELCTGTFTRITPTTSSILDYAIVTKDLVGEVIRMGIDTDVDLFTGSDHVALRIDVKLKGHGSNGLGLSSNKLFLRSDSILAVAKNLMDTYLRDQVWNQLSLNEKCELLQWSVVNANTVAYEGAKPKSARKVIQLKKLRKERQSAEKQRNNALFQLTQQTKTREEHKNI